MVPHMWFLWSLGRGQLIVLTSVVLNSSASQDAALGQPAATLGASGSSASNTSTADPEDGTHADADRESPFLWMALEEAAVLTNPVSG